MPTSRMGDIAVSRTLDLGLGLWSNLDMRTGRGQRKPESRPCYSSRRTGFCCWKDSSQQTSVWPCSGGSVRLWLRWTSLCTAGQNFPPRKMSSFKPRQVPGAMRVGVWFWWVLSLRQQPGREDPKATHRLLIRDQTSAICMPGTRLKSCVLYPSARTMNL